MVGVLLTTALLSAWAPKAEAVSEHHWHTAPCGGNVTLVARNLHRAYAHAEPPCTVAYDPRTHWTYPQFCHTIVHEFGHLLGHQHSTDPTDVMYPVLVTPIRACRRH